MLMFILKKKHPQIVLKQVIEVLSTIEAQMLFKEGDRGKTSKAEWSIGEDEWERGRIGRHIQILNREQVEHLFKSFESE